MKQQLRKPSAAVFFIMFLFIAGFGRANAFTNNRYLAYGKKPKAAQPTAIRQIATGPETSSSDINNLVNTDINRLVSEGLLKGQKGDKGDPGTDVAGAIGGPVPVSYNENIPGSIASFTELSGGDVVAASSLTVGSGALVEISPGSNLEVDANANFTASTTMGDLDVATIESPSGAYLSEGGDWVNASSRDLKTNLATVSPQSVLTEIDALPIYTWNYKTQTASSTHMGPMAQDFYSTFGLGESSSSISTLDPAGVALSGIQGLDAKLSSLTDISWITNGLKNLGMDIEQGVIKVEGVVAQTIQTDQLEVGSSDQPTGITIYDSVTKQPVCVFSANNVLQSSAGKCGVVQSAAAQPTQSGTVQPQATTTPDSLDAETPSSSPNAIANVLPTPDPTQATSTPQAPLNTDSPADATASSTTGN